MPADHPRNTKEKKEKASQAATSLMPGSDSLPIKIHRGGQLDPEFRICRLAPSVSITSRTPDLPSPGQSHCHRALEVPIFQHPPAVPELPEVETTRRGIIPHVEGMRIREVIVRRSDLRQPVSSDLAAIEGRRITGVARRSKYLLLSIEDGSTVLIHLGMSGSLRISGPAEPWKKHDHLGILMDTGRQLRFHDPRRFGLVLRLQGDPMSHKLLAGLGPEPLGDGFTPGWLAGACANRKAAIKLVIMDAAVVVGVGNIYASEALFRAGIAPRTPANRLSKPRLGRLVEAIREVLGDAIRAGGTTLRDFLHADGNPGYFRQQLFVYERKGEPCRVCGTAIRHAVLGQRSTYWCPRCQR
jgi:formamidopyrimidine-DNA glycosylase